MSHECFDLGRLRPLDTDSMSIQVSDGISIGVVGNIPASRLGQIEAELGGKFSRVTSISIDPASRYESQNEPSERYLRPSEDCEFLRLLIGGRKALYIIASGVLRGKIAARSTISLSAEGRADVSLSLKRLKELIGSNPRIEVSASGNTSTVVASRSPSVRSIAVQSRFVSPVHLARLFLLYEAAGPIELERRVRELLRNDSENVFAKLRGYFLDFLEKYELVEKDKSLFYNKVFYGGEPEPIGEVELSRILKEHWQALGIVVAAHELVVWE